MPMMDELLRELAPTLSSMSSWTDEQWAEHDQRVAAERALAAAAEVERRSQLRRRELIDGGAPPKLVDRVTDIDPNKPGIVALDNLERGGIRVLSGGVGTGKTMAALWWLWHHGGTRPVFMRSSAFEAAGRYDQAQRGRWERASGLVLDDLGMEYADTGGNFLANLDELIDSYAGSYSTLIVTTNLAMAEFKARYGQRIASRIRDAGPDCWRVVTGPDLRGGGR